MLRVYLLLTLVTFSLTPTGTEPAVAQPEDWMFSPPPGSEQTYRRAHQALLDFRLPVSEPLWRQLTTTYPDNAYYAYQYASLAFWRAMVIDTEKYFDDFAAKSEELFDKLDDRPASPWREYLYAEAYLQRAMLHAKQQRALKAAWAGRKAYHRFDSLVDEHPNFYAPRMGLGLIETLLGSLPGTYRWVFEMLGFRASIPAGLKHLREAANQSRYNSEVAGGALGLIEVILGREGHRGVERIRKLWEEHPQSLMFGHLYGYVLVEERDADRALKVYEQIVPWGDDSSYLFIDYALYYMGASQYLRGDFEAAEQTLKKYLNTFTGQSLVAMAKYRCGVSIEMQGRYSEATEYYRMITTERTYDSDLFAKRHADLHLEGPMTEAERTLLLGRNAVLAGHFEAAIDRLSPLYEADNQPQRIRSGTAYWLGRAYHLTGATDRAMQYYGYVRENPGDRSARWLPWTVFYQGTIYADRGQRDTARQHYEKVFSYEHSFDFKNGLHQRVQVALALLDETL